MNKGFTLVELLAVMVILAIIGGIGIVSYTSIMNKSKGDYYTSFIDNLKLGAADYFEDNRSKRPGVGEKCSKVSLKTLVDNRYIEKALDASGDSCNLNNSYVYIKRNANAQYEYRVMLYCNDFEEIFVEDNYCRN